MAKCHSHARGRGFFLGDGCHTENPLGFLPSNASGRFAGFGCAAHGGGLHRLAGSARAIVSGSMAAALVALRSQCRHTLAFCLWHWPIGAGSGLHHILYFSAASDRFGGADFEGARETCALGRHWTGSLGRSYCHAPGHQCRFAVAILGGAGDFGIGDFLRLNGDYGAAA